MGYTTYFTGKLTITPTLDSAQVAYLQAFNETRRMQRSTYLLQSVTDSVRQTVGLPLGIEGEYFVGYRENMGQGHSNDILNYNNPPKTQPGLWCQWTVSDDGMFLEWDEGEKFNNYIEWLQYLADNFFSKWGRALNGTIEWEGEDRSDMGRIIVTDNQIMILEAKIIFEEAKDDQKERKVE